MEGARRGDGARSGGFLRFSCAGILAECLSAAPWAPDFAPIGYAPPWLPILT